MALAVHQHRVIDEKHDLDQKILSLELFIGGDQFTQLNAKEKVRMQKQLDIMQRYSEILEQRIKFFTTVEQRKSNE